MTASEAMKAARQAIGEKVGWADRSLARMRAADGGPEMTKFQDALWSFLAAFASAQYYFTKAMPGRKGEGRDAIDPRVEKWLRARETGDLDTWRVLWRSRGLDVHVSPAAVDIRRAEHSELNAIAATARLGVTFNRRWFVLELPAGCKAPGSDGTVPCVPLCAKGLALLQSYLNDLDLIAGLGGDGR